MEKEKTQETAVENMQQQQQPPKDIKLNIGGELRNYQVEHLSDDAKSKISRVGLDEAQVLPMIQRIFVLASMGQRVEAEAMEKSLPNKYEVVKQPAVEEEAPEQPNGKAADK